MPLPINVSFQIVLSSECLVAMLTSSFNFIFFGRCISVTRSRCWFLFRFFFLSFLAAGEAEQIQSSVLVFSMFLFSNLYPYCQSRVSFGYLDFQGTSPQGALYPLGHFTLWGPLPLGSFYPYGPFALRGSLPFMIFYFLGHLDFLGLLGSFLNAGS